MDFKSAPTRNVLVNITLIGKNILSLATKSLCFLKTEPPISTTIIDFRGQEVEAIAGPYEQDSIVTLTCVSSGGKQIYQVFDLIKSLPGNPSPEVTWWRENRLIDRSYEKTYQSVVQNTVKIGPLARKDLGTVITCLSTNNNISVPVSSRVTVDMIFPPVDVSITTMGQPLSVGISYTVTCEVAGTRPDPEITWWLGGEKLKQDHLVDKDKDIIRSTLIFTPETGDHGKALACRAENPLIADSGIEDRWTLSVYCKSNI